MKYFNVIKNDADRQDLLQSKSKAEGENNYPFPLGTIKRPP